jgi:hypothetical protein
MKLFLRCVVSALAIVIARGQVPDFTKVSSFPIGSTTFVSGTFGAGKFVAVTTNAIAYSTDNGVTWLQAKGYPTIYYQAVLFGGDRFVAAGLGNQTAYSMNGVDWSFADLPGSHSFNRIAYGNGKFALSGDSRGFSNDGRSWSLTSRADSTVAFANGNFLFSGDIPFVSSSFEYFGTTFTGGVNPGSLVSTPTLFVCEATYSAPVNRYMVSLVSSSDGTSWPVGGPGPPFGPQLFQVQGGFVQSSIGGLALPDGTSASDPPGSFQAFASFAWDQSTLLAFCVGQIWRYNSGNWLQSPNKTEIGLAGAAADGNLFVGAGSTYSAGALIPSILVATNGLPATMSITPPDGTGALTAIRHEDGKFVATGKGGTIIRSTDGLNWTRRLSNTTSDLFDLAYGNGIWVAVGDSGKIVTSSDTSVFSLRFSGTEVPIFGICYGVNQFVAVGKDGLVTASTNGVDWSATGTDEARDLYSIAYGSGRFVAVGTNGIVEVSTNGAQWQPTTIPNVTAFRRVAFGNGSFVALTSTNNFLYASKDGLNWTSTQIADVNLYGLDFSDSELWLTGEKSSIYKTSLSPALAPTARGELDVNKQFVLTIQAPVAGNYTIETSPALPAITWDPVATLSNIQTSAIWTDTNVSSAMKFYRVRRE